MGQPKTYGLTRILVAMNLARCHVLPMQTNLPASSKPSGVRGARLEIMPSSIASVGMRRSTGASERSSSIAETLYAVEAEVAA